MTTPLTKSVTRMVTIGDVRYKAVMTTSGVRLTQQTKRRGIEVTWSSLISLIEREGREADVLREKPGTGVPEVITHDVAREIKSAVAALGRANDAFRAAGILPPEVLAEVASDPFHGKPEREPDWFIEPLLTSKELSSILRLPNASVRALGIKSISIAGETRYRQSVVRAYLIEQESANAGMISGPVGFSSPSVSNQREHPYSRHLKSFYNRNR